MTVMLRFNALGDCLVYSPPPPPPPSEASDAAAAAAEASDNAITAAAEAETEAAEATWEALATQRELKRRYYAVQRARDAQVLGASRLPRLFVFSFLPFFGGGI